MMVLAKANLKETLTIRPTILMSLIYWMMVHPSQEISTTIEMEISIDLMEITEISTETITEISIEIKINLIISESSKTIKKTLGKLICLMMNPTY